MELGKLGRIADLAENTNGGIPMTTLNQAIGEQKVDFLKIDVEGMESAISG